MTTTRREFLTRTTAGAAALSACTSIPGPRTTTRPNFLFFFPDQHRYDWVEWNESVPVPTPNLAELRERGVNFPNAIVDSPVCGPSRACLASGSHYDRCGVSTNADNFPTDRISYYKALRDSGYHVMGCGKLDLHKGDYSWGVDGKGSMEAWGFSDMIDNGGKGGAANAYWRDPVGAKEPYYAYLDSLEPPLAADWAGEVRRLGEVKWNQIYWTEQNPKRDKMLVDETWFGATDPVSLPDEAYCDNWIARNGLDLLDRSPDDKPWHLVLNFVGPHPPMDITESMARSYRGPDRTIDGFQQPVGYDGPFGPERHVRIRQNYGAMIENVDRWLGIFVETLKERGDYDNTVIVYSSDHGEMLGDLGLWGKNLPHQSSVGVPLCIAGPGIKSLPDSDALASLIDVTATFMDYGEAGELEYQDGHSLRPLLEGVDGTYREHSRSSLTFRGRPWRFVQNERYKLVEGYPPEGRQLFDREADPLQTEDIADAKPGMVEELSRLMADG